MLARVLCILGASLIVNSSWKNPSGEWHVGCKLVFELFTDDLTSRVKVNLSNAAIRVICVIYLFIT